MPSLTPHYPHSLCQPLPVTLCFRLLLRSHLLYESPPRVTNSASIALPPHKICIHLLLAGKSLEQLSLLDHEIHKIFYYSLLISLDSQPNKWWRTLHLGIYRSLSTIPHYPSPISTVLKTSSFITLESAPSLQVSLSISPLQRHFIPSKLFLLPFPICNSLSSFVLPSPSLFHFLFFFCPFRNHLQDLAFMTLDTYSPFVLLFFTCQYICNYPHTIHSSKHSFISFSHQILISGYYVK